MPCRFPTKTRDRTKHSPTSIASRLLQICSANSITMNDHTQVNKSHKIESDPRIWRLKNKGGRILDLAPHPRAPSWCGRGRRMAGGHGNSFLP